MVCALQQHKIHCLIACQLNIGASLYTQVLGNFVVEQRNKKERVKPGELLYN